MTEQQHMSDVDLPDHVFRWLEAVQRRVARELGPRLDDTGRAVGPRRLRVLQLIPHAGIRQTELAARALVTKQALGQVIDGLEADGLVDRTLDPLDGRAWLVVLSPTGEKVAASFDQAMADVEVELAKVAGPKDFATFMAVLRKLGSHEI